MKIKFNKFERVAGLFVGTVVVLFLMSLVSIGIKQGWLEKKIDYMSVFESAEGVHSGTVVQMSGLKIGTVNDVELTKDNRILVKFTVLSKFQDRIHADSYVQLIRPFVIGERVLDIAVGTEGFPVLAENAEIASRRSTDLMTLMSGKELGKYFETVTEMLKNLHFLAEMMLNKDRTKSLVKVFDQLEPTFKNLNGMTLEMTKLSKQMTHGEHVPELVAGLTKTTRELNVLIPEFNKNAPHLAKDMSELVKNLGILTQEFKAIIPAIAEVGPELPGASRRALEALDEAVVLIKAMQKSFVVSGNVKDVREEEAARKKEREKEREKQMRLPANKNRD